jgi:hypothetical protein
MVLESMSYGVTACLSSRVISGCERARRQVGVTVVFQWCYSGVTVVLQWCYSGVTVVLKW